MKWINIHDKLPDIVDHKVDDEITEDSKHVLVYHTVKGVGLGCFYIWKQCYDLKLKKMVKANEEIENEDTYICSVEYISREVEDGIYSHVYDNIHIYKPHINKKEGTITHWMDLPEKPE